MKTIQNLLLLLSITFVFPLLANSQIAYHHYLDSTYSWSEGRSSVSFPGGSPCYMGGLTVTASNNHIIGIDSLDGFWWYQVHQDVQSTNSCDFGPTYVGAPYPYPDLQYIREDSSGKIWRRGFNGRSEMMYDFGQPIAVGGTVWMGDSIFACNVDRIDSVYIGQEARARYWCACDSNTSPFIDPGYVIEGVGHSRGFHVFMNPCDLFADNNQYLICATIQTDTMIIDSLRPCGYPGHIVVGVNDVLENDLQVWWDETSELIQIRSSRPVKNANWLLYDLNGRTLAKGDRISDQISVPSLLPGMYLFVLKDDSRMKVLRFLKRQ